uniref:Uncharacterized protein n=1 Tax=Acrobeloides nanus TaxID=290746 RepID=A0A914CMF5_9BILA
MVAGLLGICYSVLIIGFIVKAKKLGESQTIAKFQIIVTLQAVLICIEISFAASIYIIIQYFSIPYFVMISTHVMWMLVHGDTPIVYLALNKSLRNAVLDMFNLRRRFSTGVGEIRQVPSREHNPSNIILM